MCGSSASGFRRYVLATVAAVVAFIVVCFAPSALAANTTPVCPTTDTANYCSTLLEPTGVTYSGGWGTMTSSTNTWDQDFMTAGVFANPTSGSTETITWSFTPRLQDNGGVPYQARILYCWNSSQAAVVTSINWKLDGAWVSPGYVPDSTLACFWSAWSSVSGVFDATAVLVATDSTANAGRVNFYEVGAQVRYRVTPVPTPTVTTTAYATVTATATAYSTVTATATVTSTATATVPGPTVTATYTASPTSTPTVTSTYVAYPANASGGPAVNVTIDPAQWATVADVATASFSIRDVLPAIVAGVGLVLLFTIVVAVSRFRR